MTIPPTSISVTIPYRRFTNRIWFQLTDIGHPLAEYNVSTLDEAYRLVIGLVHGKWPGANVVVTLIDIDY